MENTSNASTNSISHPTGDHYKLETEISYTVIQKLRDNLG